MIDNFLFFQYLPFNFDKFQPLSVFNFNHRKDYLHHTSIKNIISYQISLPFSIDTSRSSSPSFRIRNLDIVEQFG